MRVQAEEDFRIVQIDRRVAKVNSVEAEDGEEQKARPERAARHASVRNVTASRAPGQGTRLGRRNEVYAERYCSVFALHMTDESFIHASQSLKSIRGLYGPSGGRRSSPSGSLLTSSTIFA